MASFAVSFLLEVLVYFGSSVTLAKCGPRSGGYLFRGQ
jgi:hypothetical protein